MNHFLHGVARAISEAFPLPEPILEIGSYQVAGQDAISDLRGLFPGKTYQGVDCRPGPGVDRVASIESLPYADGSVGTVIAMNTLEHVPRYWRGLAEIYRVLSPDGVVLLSCPFYFKIHNYPGDYWRFTPQAFELLLEDYPTRLLGWHGPKNRPANVWALACGRESDLITPARFENYRELVARYAFEPMGRLRRWRLQMGSWVFGQRPFRPYLEQNHWENDMVRDQDNFAIDVSVCIANWNCRELLKGCLQTLNDHAQRVRLEIIVVDNGSHDGAADMVSQEFPHVRLLRNAENLGYARANNQAASSAQGRYLFFLNNDTRLPPGALGALVDFLDKHPDVGMVGPRLRDDAGHIQVSYRPQPTLAALLHRTCLFRCSGILRRAYLKYRRLHFNPDKTQRVDVLMGAAILIRRDRFLALGGWDEDFLFGGEDMELSYRVNRQAPVIYYPEVEITHLGRASTRQNCALATISIATGLVKYLRKAGYSPLGVLFFKLAYTLDAPLAFLEPALQYLWRRLWRRRAKAEQSLRDLRGLAAFLSHGLLPFWKA